MAKKRTRAHISLTLNPDILEWMDSLVGPFSDYKTRSDAFDAAAIALMREKSAKGAKVPKEIKNSPMFKGLQ